MENSVHFNPHFNGKIEGERPALSSTTKLFGKEKTVTPLPSQLKSKPTKKRGWMATAKKVLSYIFKILLSVSMIAFVGRQVLKNKEESTPSTPSTPKVDSEADKEKSDSNSKPKPKEDSIPEPEEIIPPPPEVCYDQVIAEHMVYELPYDLEIIRQIDDLEARARVLAILINDSKTPLSSLNLSKEELQAAAPHLTYVDCRDCFADDELWDKDAIETFLSNCHSTRHLLINSDKVSELPAEALANCETVDCSNCVTLHTIPTLPFCREFIATGCYNLDTIGNLPSCTRFDCSKCYHLSQLPPLAPNCWITQNNCIHLLPVPYPILNQINHFHGSNLDVHVGELQHYPLKVLLDITPSLLGNQRNLPSITFIEKNGDRSPGQDAGGLRKTLISRLMENLVDSSDERSALRFSKGEKGALPVLQEGRIPSQIKAFKVMGALFAKGFAGQGYTVGQLFDPKLFKMICSFSEAELNPNLSSSSDISDHLWLKTLISSEEDSYFINYCRTLQKGPNNLTEEDLEVIELMGIEREDENGKQKSSSEIYQEAMKELRKDHSSVFPAFVIASEMKAVLTEQGVVRRDPFGQRYNSSISWEEVTQTDPSKLQEKIEGTLNKESVKQALDWGMNNNQQIRRFMEQWIDTASKEQLKNLILGISGWSSLPPGKNLHIHVYPSGDNSCMNSHTCSNQLDLPNYSNYDAFKEKVEEFAINAANQESSGFGFV